MFIFPNHSGKVREYPRLSLDFKGSHRKKSQIELNIIVASLKEYFCLMLLYAAPCVAPYYRNINYYFSLRVAKKQDHIFCSLEKLHSRLYSAVWWLLSPQCCFLTPKKSWRVSKNSCQIVVKFTSNNEISELFQKNWIVNKKIQRLDQMSSSLFV